MRYQINKLLRSSLVLGGCLLLLLPWLASAGQGGIPSYRAARDVFWHQLYPHGAWTLYCGKYMHGPDIAVEVDHIYPVDWMVTAAGCHTRSQCQASNERFNRMEADLHNMYAALAIIESARPKRAFGMVSGEDHLVQPSCDFEHDLLRHLSEPRPLARGNLARAIFYMHAEYNLPIPPDMLMLLKRWNREDPPSQHERMRNRRIEAIQGTRNRFIDQPALGETIKAP
jgi:deoxyribonuclease-1